jgi:uncharacterized protein YutE (UPF0331/DUF86 family)
VNALRGLQSLTYEEFVEDHIVSASAERNFQVAIQAALDIGGLLLSALSTDVPREYGEIFPRLAEIGVLPGGFAQRLVQMAKFRNVLVHLYITVDTKRVYHYLQHDLGDLELFAQYVGKYLAGAGMSRQK